MPDTAGPGELWIRATRLMERCSVTLHVVAVPPGWKVRITAHSDPKIHADGVGEHIVEALAKAVALAEQMGLEPPPAELHTIAAPTSTSTQTMPNAQLLGMAAGTLARADQTVARSKDLLSESRTLTEESRAKSHEVTESCPAS